MPLGNDPNANSGHEIPTCQQEKFILSGGRDGLGAQTDTFVVIDKDGSECSSCKSQHKMPYKAAAHCMVESNGYLVAIGGVFESSILEGLSPKTSLK